VGTSKAPCVSSQTNDVSAPRDRTLGEPRGLRSQPAARERNIEGAKRSRQQRGVRGPRKTTPEAATKVWMEWRTQMHFIDPYLAYVDDAAEHGRRHRWP
jgi:hypothetical protein